jgi:hypothetical protein
MSMKPPIADKVPRVNANIFFAFTGAPAATP